MIFAKNNKLIKVDSDNNKLEPQWLANLLDTRPEFVWIGPFMAYLLLLGLNDKTPEQYMYIPIAIRGLGALVVVGMVWRRLPSFGKAHLYLAIPLGILAAAGWIHGHHLFEYLGLGGSWFNLRAPSANNDPRIGLSPAAWWSQAVFRIAVATITVPIVEELFWRGFMLRALTDWYHFEQVPAGRFAWKAFIGTALLSTMQHPAHWGISILCWLVFNALFYWKKSLLFLMIVHGMTNLTLYLYVIYCQDWIFW